MSSNDHSRRRYEKDANEKEEEEGNRSNTPIYISVRQMNTDRINPLFSIVIVMKWINRLRTKAAMKCIDIEYIFIRNRLRKEKESLTFGRGLKWHLVEEISEWLRKENREIKRLDGKRKLNRDIFDFDWHRIISLEFPEGFD